MAHKNHQTVDTSTKTDTKKTVEKASPKPWYSSFVKTVLWWAYTAAWVGVFIGLIQFSITFFTLQVMPFFGRVIAQSVGAINTNDSRFFTLYLWPMLFIAVACGILWAMILKTLADVICRHLRRLWWKSGKIFFGLLGQSFKKLGTKILNIFKKPFAKSEK